MDKVEIVIVAMAYDDPIMTQTFILIMRNALYIPSTGYNLILLFIMREASLYVDETRKFQLANWALLDNHCVYDPESGLQTHL